MNTTKSTATIPVAGIALAATFEIILCITGTIGNSLTIAAIVKKKSLHSATNFFIAALAIADLLVSGILVPMRASQHIAMARGRSGAISPAAVEISGFIGRVNIIASISCLCALSIDRCIALSRPVKYITSFKHATGKVLIIIAAIWTTAIIITSIPKFPGVSDTPFLIFFVAFVLIATVIIAIAYCKIFKIAKKASRRRGKTTANLVRLSVCTTMDPRLKQAADAQEEREEHRTQQAQRQEHKAAKTIGIVIAAFIVLVYPRIILILYHFGATATNDSKHARFWIRILLYSNSSINPALYAWRHRNFRKEFIRLLRELLDVVQCKKHSDDWETRPYTVSSKVISTSSGK